MCALVQFMNPCAEGGWVLRSGRSTRHRLEPATSPSEGRSHKFSKHGGGDLRHSRMTLCQLWVWAGHLVDLSGQVEDWCPFDSIGRRSDRSCFMPAV